MPAKATACFFFESAIYPIGATPRRVTLGFRAFRRSGLAQWSRATEPWETP